MPFVRLHEPCKRVVAGSLPQITCDAVYHFRTPSPGGQHVSQDVMLPAFFFAPYQDVTPDVSTRHTNASVYDIGPLFLLDHTVPNSIAENEKELKPCHSNLLLLHLLQPLDWPHVAIHLVNKRCPEPSLVLRALPFSTVTLAPVPLSARLVVSRIVNSRAAVTDRRNAHAYRRRGLTKLTSTLFSMPQPAASAKRPLLARPTRPSTSHAKRRLAFGQGGVLRFTTQKGETHV